MEESPTGFLFRPLKLSTTISEHMKLFLLCDFYYFLYFIKNLLQLNKRTKGAADASLLKYWEIRELGIRWKKLWNNHRFILSERVIIPLHEIFHRMKCETCCTSFKISKSLKSLCSCNYDEVSASMCTSDKFM